MKLYDVAVVGGGASGLAAAIMALRSGAKVALVERGPRVGRKLLATGNGRCNLTNAQAAPQNYHGGVSLIGSAMGAFSPRRVMDFFESIGLMCVETHGARVYPLCDQAAAVLDALRLCAQELGCDFFLEFDANNIINANGFRIAGPTGKTVNAKTVVLATGGPASPSLGGTEAGFSLFRQLGHRVTPLMPALTQLVTQTQQIRPLKGVKIDGRIALKSGGDTLDSACGDILFTQYGLSGTAVMAVSRAAALALMEKRQLSVSICALDKPRDAVYSLLVARRRAMPQRSLEDFLTGTINKRLGQTYVKLAGAAPLSRLTATLSDGELSQIARLMTDFPIEVWDTRGFTGAQTSAGGADTREFFPDTLMSRKVPGLFACGEALDIDADCGGFNLQWAWASGLFAGQNAAKTSASLPK
jgi:predicted Rossmann fold flavoprotein